MVQQKPYKVLVSPLDWGIGHATRCIPIIYYLMEKGISVSLASDGKSYDLLKKEFPTLIIYKLQGYKITYQKSGKQFSLKLLQQVHKIIYAVFCEHVWLKKMQKKNNWDLVISDNRYGFYNKKTTSIIITHQLHIHSGMGRFVDRWVQKILYGYINRFNRCWIPDSLEEPNLTGILAHPIQKPKYLEYIGPISRMKKIEVASSHKILILLSGPEPQRTLLEQILLKQAEKIDKQFILVRGLPSETSQPMLPTNVTSFNYLGASELTQALSSASIVVCRSGYSSLMDIVKMEKKAILIPTPGQTEQEYLGKRFMDKKMFVCQNQDEVNLLTGLEQLNEFTEQSFSIDFEQYKKALSALGIK